MDKKLQKEAFIEAFKKTFGNITQSCKAVGIVRQTYYNWLDSDVDFAQELGNVKAPDRFLDFVARKLVEKINAGDTTSIIFALKTKGKSRGYVERQEIETNAFPDNVKVEIVK